MKSLKTMASPPIVHFTFRLPIFIFVWGMIAFFSSNPIPGAVLFFVASAVWFFTFLYYRNAFPVSEISDTGISSKYLKLEWSDIKYFCVATTLANVNHARKPPPFHGVINAKCIYFGNFVNGNIRKQNVKQCLILPVCDDVIKAINVFDHELCERILTDIRLESRLD